jgi:CheY-like chemotaxis protein
MAKILVADDNRANRQALSSWLENAGHEVSTAADGREAFAKAREERPDLVISDVLMPLMDGYELARRLRGDPTTASTGLMFYTAYFGRDDAQELAQAHGVARVLVKPSDPDLILVAVNEVLASAAGEDYGARGAAASHPTAQSHAFHAERRQCADRSRVRPPGASRGGLPHCGGEGRLRLRSRGPAR